MRKMLLFIAVAISVLPLPSIAAQAVAIGPRTPALVAISPETVTGMPFRIARFAGNSAQDVILLSSDADAGTLTLAVQTLMAARRTSGNVASENGMLRVRPENAGSSRSHAVLPCAGRYWWRYAQLHRGRLPALAMCELSRSGPPRTRGQDHRLARRRRPVYRNSMGGLARGRTTVARATPRLQVI
jgi:hypothetical protein